MFSERLKALRKECGISQRALAQRLGVSQQAVAKWEAASSTPGPNALATITGAWDRQGWLWGLCI